MKELHFAIFILAILVPFFTCYYVLYTRFGGPAPARCNRLFASFRWRNRFSLAVSCVVGEFTGIATADFLRHASSAANLRRALLYSGWWLVIGIPAAWLGNWLFGTATPVEHGEPQ
jgi:hypothetical protein